MDSKKVGLAGLVAIVFTSMVGSGVYNIPQNMAAEASAGASLIAWIITGVGMLFLALTFKLLSDKRPDITSGIYGYAREDLGDYVGFNAAWGYWVSGAVGNVAFAILLNDALGFFYPVLKEHGWETIVLCLGMIWFFSFIVMFGVEFATKLSSYSTIIIMIALSVILGCLIYAFDWNTFVDSFFGEKYNLPSVGKQIKSTMMVTLWCFIGIEGAVVISDRAQKKSDVGRATMIGLVGALFIYSAICLLSFGIMTQPELSKAVSPSAGSVLKVAVGNWGNEFVNIAVILSLLVSWLAWTVLVAEVPYAASKDGLLPKFFDRENRRKAPVSSLVITAILMTIVMGLVFTASDVYLAAVNIASVMIIPPYVLSSLYLWDGTEKHKLTYKDHKRRIKGLIIGIGGTFYGVWLLYSAGISYLLMSAIFYFIGIPFYYRAKREHLKSGVHIFNNKERVLAILIIIATIVAVSMMLDGKLTT
ncbi:basic amino acid/polyamine antiporter [Halosquirtibacter xylanolyticus]|uniref:basic amino acid/polyamine antiporter n=1 Tax=Halosquirtibacter xylanolyticus TaxID=3374599 RepID=UPI0037483C3C|nr:basic amino acid/polyamine antiporter [Prolixibacteraceae bacterium]